MGTRYPALFAAFLGVCGPAWAQCSPEWLPTASIPGVTGDLPVTCATTWDPDGVGPREPVLVIGGGFEAAGNVVSFGIATWDGEQWAGLGASGMGGMVRVLAVYQGDLIAAGDFFVAGGVPAQRIARFDGTSWHPLGTGLNQTVRALTVYNGELIACGLFTDAGGGTADYIARWNGASWQPLGSGVNNAAIALTVHNGDLVAGGGFTIAGGQAADKVARWNGSAWQGVNDPYNVIQVEALHTYQGELVAAGTFVNPSTNVMDFVVRWTGSAWQELGTGTNDHVMEFFEYRGDLVCGGFFTNAGGVSAFHLARWNGSFWAPVFGMRSVEALTEYRGDLIVGGLGTKPNEMSMSLVLRWDGAAPAYIGGGTDGVIHDFETYAGELYAAGDFGMIDGVISPAIARRDAAGEWQEVPSPGLGVISDLAIFDGGLLASGDFGTSRWNGKTWQFFSGTSVSGMLMKDGALYAALGLTGPNTVGRWNPAFNTWEVVGKFPEAVYVGDLTVLNGALVAGGFGNTANVWRLDNGAWVPVGGWMGPASVQTLAVYNGDLVAGGYFGGTFTNILYSLARFNGTDWEPLGGGVAENGGINVTAVFDLEVRAGKLVVAGSFSHVGAGLASGVIGANSIAEWDGAHWSAFGTGLNDAAVCIHPQDAEIHVGGWFQMAGGKPAGHWARWGCEAPACYPDCNGDAALNLADFGCFQTKFALGDPYADCNGDGVRNLSDFGCFQTRFALACR